MHPLFLIPALMVAPASAQDVLVPEFTPVIAEDFTLAYMFYSLVVDELRVRDVAFIDGDQLRQVAGSDAEGCSESITCPSGLWAYFPGTSLSLVGTVGLYNMGTASESIEVRVEFYERDGYQPFKTVERTIVPGGEADFAAALAKATEVLVQRLTAAPEPTPEPDATHVPRAGPEGRRSTLRGRAGRSEPDPEPAPTPEDQLYQSYYDVDDGEDDDRRKDKPPKAEREPRQRDDSRASTRTPREPKPEREPRERSASSSEHHLLQAQAFAGLAIGDVGRSYDVRMSVMGSANSELGRYEHDTFTGGVGTTFGGGIMVAPVEWLSVGAQLGVVTGRKYLSTGYERWAQGEQGSVEIQDYKAAPAMRGLIQPRVAVAPLAIGALRPSVHAFFGFRRYDGYEVTDLTDLAYPDRNGGWQLVPGAGLGAVYDLGEGRGISLELSHAVRLGADDIHHVQQGLVTENPEIPDTAERTTTIAVGFTQGFM